MTKTIDGNEYPTTLEGWVARDLNTLEDGVAYVAWLIFQKDMILDPEDGPKEKEADMIFGPHGHKHLSALFEKAKTIARLEGLSITQVVIVFGTVYALDLPPQGRTSFDGLTQRDFEKPRFNKWVRKWIREAAMFTLTNLADMGHPAVVRQDGGLAVDAERLAQDLPPLADFLMHDGENMGGEFRVAAVTDNTPEGLSNLLRDNLADVIAKKKQVEKEETDDFDVDGDENNDDPFSHIPDDEFATPMKHSIDMKCYCASQRGRKLRNGICPNCGSMEHDVYGKDLWKK